MLLYACQPPSGMLCPSRRAAIMRSPWQLTLCLFIIVGQPHSRQGCLLPVPTQRQVGWQAAPMVGHWTASAGDKLPILARPALGVAATSLAGVQGAAPGGRGPINEAGRCS